ncbi:MAG: hypothetical protein QGG54_17775, partial [Gammaproteobacteria bacterium]|nr:hypothetical protein [Gammaproteobacteria bacterium]
MSEGRFSAAGPRMTIGRWLLFLMLGAFVLVYLTPLYVMIITSLKSLDEIRVGSILTWPETLTVVSWAKAWGSACVGIQCDGVKPFFWNSVQITAPAVVISTLLGAVNGYVLTKWRFRFDNIV